MKLQQLVQFVAVAETQSFRKAAQRVHTAQPPLSASIRKLEEEFGGPLFVRSASGAQLTTLGAALLEPARNVLRAVEACRLTMHEVLHGMGGTIRLGYVGSAAYTLVSDLIEATKESAPRTEFKLQAAGGAEIMKGLIAGTLDAGLVRYPVMEAAPMRIDPLLPDELMLAMRADAAPRGTRRIKLRDMADQPFISISGSEMTGVHALLMLLCQHAGFVPRVVQHTRDLVTMLGLVRAGLGVALVPSLARPYVDASVRFFSLMDLPPGLETGLALATLRDGDPLVDRFRQLVLSRFSKVSRSK
jgi:DNA-binding transcriptional LysR family regulator